MINVTMYGIHGSYGYGCFTLTYLHHPGVGCTSHPCLSATVAALPRAPPRPPPGPPRTTPRGAATPAASSGSNRPDRWGPGLHP